MTRVCGVTERIAVDADMSAISAVMCYGTDVQKKLAAEIVMLATSRQSASRNRKPVLRRPR
jgi:hypothetical protein